MKRPVRFAAFLVAGLAIAAGLAFFVSPRASSEPDGLNRVAIDEGFAETETDHPLAGTPTAGYGVEGVDDEGLSTGLAGVIGVAMTFAVAGGLMLVVRRAGGRPAAGRRPPRRLRALGGAGMSGSHLAPDSLYVAGTSPLHRCRPEAKLAATLAFVFAVVVTPREAVWAFGLHAAVIAGAVAASALPAGLVLRRLRVELPFLAFAAFLPLIGSAPHTDLLGLSLSEPGLWAAWNIVAKGTLGVAASIVLASTTTVPDLLRGLERLRMPRVVTAIAGFMVRYLGIVVGEASRMHVARQSRGYDPRWLWQARGVAASAGTLFVRAYERGERVHLAMISRGYDGTMPDLTGARPSAAGSASAAWAPAALAPACAWVVALAALVTA